MKFASCNCPVGVKFHALNCPTSPGEEQRVPEWAKRDLKADRYEDKMEWDERVDRDRHARAHFPNLSPAVTPRESDEYPTFWEA